MSIRFSIYEWSVLAQSKEGQYYELKKWKVGPMGEVEAIEKEPLTLKQALRYLEGLDPYLNDQ